MKKLVFALSVLSLLVIVSCGKDDDPTPGLSGTINYNGESYSIKNGIFSLSESGGNASGSFFIADGVITSSSSNSVSSSDSNIIITVTATDKNASSLSAGDYATSTNVPDKFADVSVTTADGRKEAFTGGTVSISGSGNTYTVAFDVPFGQGVTMTGSVSGTYVNL
ncbi:MAG: hypothetical protein Tsb0034_22110 [Ekhidna sp.]